MLAPFFQKVGLQIELWNEPSSLTSRFGHFDPGHAFHNLLLSAGKSLEQLSDKHKKVNLIAHSFGTHAATYLSQKHPNAINKIVLITPALTINQCEKNVFLLAASDFKIQKEDIKAQLMLSYIEQLEEQYNSARENAAALAMEDPMLFKHYWIDHQKMNEYFKYFTSEGFGLDLKSLLAVRRTMTRPPQLPVDIKCVALFGEKDKIVNSALEYKELKKIYQHLQSKIIPNTSHYPHLEQPEALLELVKQL